MQLDISNVAGWKFLKSPDRVDALNVSDFMKALETHVDPCDQIALDLRNVHFLNFQALRFVHQLALKLRQKGGQLALVGPSEKVKRQFSLFASLAPFTLFSSTEWSRQKPHQNALEIL